MIKVSFLNIFLRLAHVPVDFEYVQLDSHQAVDNVDLENAIISIERNGVAIKGNIETKIGDASLRSRNVELRYVKKNKLKMIYKQSFAVKH